MRMQHMGQMFQPQGGTSYFMPTMPQAQRFYSPQAMAQAIRAQPRWNAQGAPQVRAAAQAPTAFPMQAAPYRSAPRQSQPQPRWNAQGAPQVRAAAQAPTAALMQARPVAPAQAPAQVPPAAMGARAASAAAFKYGQQIRPGPGGAAAPQGVPQPAVHIQGQEPLTPSLLANAQPQEQKQMLGERLFPLIEQMHPLLAGKITGMLLEIDNTDLLQLLEDRASLTNKVEEAVAVLKAHQAKQAHSVQPKKEEM